MVVAAKTVDLSDGHHLESDALTTLSIWDKRDEGQNKQMKKTTTRRMHAVSGLTLAGLTLAAALAGSMPASAAELGDEPHRPAIHYTPEKNWMNDPNGLVFHKGVYHLYYQHNPSGNTWGNMSWGHATSKDLVHWEEQPLAISTDAQEDVFSGSIVVDKNNTSGLRQRGKPAPDRDLHQCLQGSVPAPRPAGPVPGLQPGRRPDLDQVRRQSCPEPELSQLPRPQGLLVRQPGRRRLLGHDRGGSSGAQSCPLQVRQP